MRVCNSLCVCVCVCVFMYISARGLQVTTQVEGYCKLDSRSHALLDTVSYSPVPFTEANNREPEMHWFRALTYVLNGHRFAALRN
jgi:hypothetical protein